MSALDTSRTLANIAYVIVAVALTLSLGFGVGFVVGAEGNLFHVELTNSSIAMSDASYPCAADYNGNVRCTFLSDTNTTWICTSTRGHNETCTETAP